VRELRAAQVPRRRTRRPGERVGQLLDAAAALFARDGYTSTRISDVCKAAGLSVGTFYLNFEDKPDLIAHLIEVASEEVPTFDASSRAVFERQVCEYVRSPNALIWKAWREAILVEPRLRPTGVRVRSLLGFRLEQWIRDVRAARGIEQPAVDDRTAAWLFLASMRELIILDTGEPLSHTLSIIRAQWHMLFAP
jgi:AcrR family transcriptional regulator